MVKLGTVLENGWTVIAERPARKSGTSIVLCMKEGNFDPYVIWTLYRMADQDKLVAYRGDYMQNINEAVVRFNERI